MALWKGKEKSKERSKEKEDRKPSEQQKQDGRKWKGEQMRKKEDKRNGRADAVAASSRLMTVPFPFYTPLHVAEKSKEELFVYAPASIQVSFSVDFISSVNIRE